MEINVICATRLSKEDFLHNSLLAKSLKINNNNKSLKIKLYENNIYGLPKIYNHAIKEIQEDSILVFVHDDVLIMDFFWTERIKKLLKIYDILGIAGSCERVPFQPSWAFRTLDFKWDPNFILSGMVGHGSQYPCENLSIYGESPNLVKLLDGCFIVTTVNTIKKYSLYFDEQFNFHFYDLDFCRRAEQIGLLISTVDISIVHESGGRLGTEDWNTEYEKYINKWSS